LHTPGHQPRRALFDDYPKACLASYPFPRDLCSSALFNTQPILVLRTFHHAAHCIFSQSRRQSRPLATILPILLQPHSLSSPVCHILISRICFCPFQKTDNSHAVDNSQEAFRLNWQPKRSLLAIDSRGSCKNASRLIKPRSPVPLCGSPAMISFIPLSLQTRAKGSAVSRHILPGIEAL